MRLKSTNNEEDTKEIKEFADWMLKIGEGEVGPENDGEVEIEFPDDVLIKTDGDTLKAMVEAIYPTIDEEIGKDEYFENKAILVPTNEEVDVINEHMLSQINEEEKVYLSSDTICQTEINGCYDESIYSPELLNAFKISGLPNHCLKLKKGVPVMILRNIDQQNGLCNGTRLIITCLEDHVIEGKIISGTNLGKYTYIPRLQLMPSDKRIPFKFNRRQFPLMVCFAMTINKSQGQSLELVGLYLRKPVFTHGQLYVAISRVTTKKGLKVLLCDEEGRQTNMTTNVVYKEVLQRIYIN
ncbi:ATP-dependent DNA helicase PIF1-like protein [Tanacetum coccineum]